VSFYVSTATFVLLHCDECDRVVALPRHKFVTGATLLQLKYNHNIRTLSGSTKQERKAYQRITILPVVKITMLFFALLYRILHGHIYKHSPPSIFNYIYISYKTTFFQKNILKLSLGRFLWNLFQDTQNSLNFIYLSDSNFCLHGFCFLVI
jgi:hypothetical protein